MTKLTLEQQELLFANDCKLINLRYEYHGYTGTEKWAIVTELAEEELWVKYPDVIRRYTPYPYDRELLTGIFDLILETVLCKNKSIVVASSEYPAELVRSKFLKLNMFHVEYAMDCMRKNTSKIHNIKKYLLAALFNAPSTISGYYQAEVNHDLPQYAANDK